MNILYILFLLPAVLGQYRVTSNNNYIFCHNDITILASGNLCNTYITLYGMLRGESRYAYTLNNVSNSDIISNLPILNSYHNNDDCIQNYTQSIVTYLVKQYGACTISIYPYDETLENDIKKNIIDIKPENTAVNSAISKSLSKLLPIITILAIFYLLFI